MTDFTASRLGVVNKTGTEERELFLDKFAGEVLTQFKRRNIMMGKHRVKTIDSGRSYKFPLVGSNGAEYHKAGEQLKGNQISHADRTVTIDRLLVSHVFTDRVDEAINHYDIRSIYTKECANALSAVADRNILRVAAKAASLTDETKAKAADLVPLDEEKYTDNVSLGQSTDSAVTGKDIYEAVLAAKQIREENDIYDDAYIVLPPVMYYKLLKADTVQELVWINSDVKGAGAISSGKVPVLADMPVYLSNHVPMTDQSSSLAEGDPTTDIGPSESLYKGDYSKVRGLILSKDAVCTVKLKDLAIESEYQISRQGTLIVAKYAMGHNILRFALAQTLTLGTATLGAQSRKKAA